MLPFLLGGLTAIFWRVVAADSASYAPSTLVSCPPAGELLRAFPTTNQTLHPSEQEYIDTRSRSFPQAWQTWIGNGSQLGYDFSLLQSHVPKLSITVSGGGQRVSLYSSGVLQALDGRNATSVAASTGGLLQVASYMAGLSGGSWMLGSSIFTGFPKFDELVLGKGDGSWQGWLLDLDLVIPGGINIFGKENQYFFGSILATVYQKARAGIDTSITDPWSRAISYHYLPGTDRANFFQNDSAHGAGMLWSGIPNLPAYQSHSIPFPIVILNSRVPSSNWSTWVPLDSPVYEVTPFEMGSWDPSLSAMTSTKFLGTTLNNGQPANASSCVTGFDQAGYMLGTSSNLFNILFDDARKKLAGFDFAPAQGLIWLLRQLVNNVIMKADDVATYPNPFLGVNSNTFRDASSSWLELVDGGSNQETVPLGSLFLKARNQEVIVAIDGSADDNNNFPTGQALVFTSQRLKTILNNTHQAFPPIPATVDDFVNSGASMRPTFFGCNPTQQPPEWPLVIYMPNSPPLSGEAPVTNTKTFKLSYTRLFTEIFLRQSYNASINGFTPGSQSPDPDFGKCLQCATLDRARLKASPPIPRSEFCGKCFQRYCFDPTNPPSKSQVVGRNFKFLDPDPQGLDKALSFVRRNRIAFIAGGSALGVLLILACVGCCVKHRRRVAREQTYRQLKEESAASWAPSYEMSKTA